MFLLSFILNYIIIGVFRVSIGSWFEIVPLVGHVRRVQEAWCHRLAFLYRLSVSSFLIPTLFDANSICLCGHVFIQYKDLFDISTLTFDSNQLTAFARLFDFLRFLFLNFIRFFLLFRAVLIVETMFKSVGWPTLHYTWRLLLLRSLRGLLY